MEAAGEDDRSGNAAGVTAGARMHWRFWRSTPRDEELDDEIAHDLLLDTEERVQSGMPRAEAERASRRDFGNVLLVKEATRAARTSRMQSIGLAQAAYDIRHAARKFTHAPTFTCTVLAVLALGIAANVVVFSIANAVLLRPPAFPDPDRVVLFQTTSPTGSVVSASPAMYGHWRKQTSVVQDVVAFRHTLLNETSGTTPEQIRASRVSADYFRLFGASVYRGRTFSEQEDRPGGDAVAVASHRLWTRRFGGVEVIGQALRLNGERYTIIGVLAPAFRADDLGVEPDVWLPLQLDTESKAQGHFFSVAGRLRRDMTLTEAQARMRLSTDEFRREFPNALAKDSAFSVQMVREAIVGNARPLFAVLFGAVAFVLLIACSNLATLLSLHGVSRRREIAIRAAIGAERSRIVRQLLTESLLLSLCGGALALAVAWFAMRLLLFMGLSGVPRLNDVTTVTLDWRVVVFAVAVSIITGVLFGLIPAFRGSRAELGAVASSLDAPASRGPRRRRLEAGLVVIQVSLGLVLLIGSALFMRTVFALTRVDAGFDPDHVLTMRAWLNGPDFRTVSQVDAIVRRGTEALAAVPGVAVAGASCGLPLEDGFGLPFEIVGRPLPEGQRFHGGAAWLAVFPGYFETLRVPVKRGRGFTAADVRQNPAVAIVNDVMARQHWPGEDPIGKRLVMGHGTGPQFQDEPVREIVGVVGSVRTGRLADRPGAEMYVPQAQLPDVANAFVASGTPTAWIVRTTTAPEPLARTVQQTLQQALGLPVLNVRSMDEIVLRSILQQRLSMWLMAGFGGAALLLAMIGLYGLVAHAVEQRTREIGIRVALGAEASQVTRMVLWQGTRLVAAAIAMGLLSALALTRVIARFLFEVQPRDFATFIVVPVLVAIVAALAVWLPARRASRVDPVVALRYE
jgi:putative ABC transport system permease protein